MKKVILSISALLITTAIFSATITARFSGNWNSGLTWIGGVVPGNNDIVEITQGRNVTVNNNTPTYTNMTIEVYDGTLTIGNGAKLDMDDNGIVNIYTGSSLCGINNGNGQGDKLRIGGNTVFSGAQCVSGPTSFTKGGQVTLPVELIGFTAKAGSNAVFLKWTTATEVNNNFFTIEKSVDGVNFEFVGKEKGNGNSSIAIAYAFVDEKPYAGTSYYRLKQTDYDGTSTTFNYAVVTLNKKVETTVFPNPSNGRTTIVQFNSLEDEMVTVTIIDVTGKEIFNKVIATNDGVNSVSLDMELVKGSYIVRTSDQYSVSAKRLIIE